MEDDKNNGVQPGQTVSPQGATPLAPPQAQPPAPEIPATPPPAPEAEAAPPAEVAPPEPEQPEQPAQFVEDSQIDTDPEDLPADPAAADEQPIAWTASEFIAHAKSFGWYFALVIVAIIIAAVVYIVMRDVISSAVIIVAALLFGIYAGHKPREIQYRLDGSGLSVGEKHFSYSQFQSFSVMPEGAFSSIVFMPLKRFAVPTTIYYAPEDEDRIVSMLGSRLPMEQRGHDAVDRLMHRIHF